MRNNKRITIVLIALAIFLYSTVKVSATSYADLQNLTFDMENDIKYEDPVCTNGDAAGDYTIKWNGQKLIMGAINATCTKYKNGDPISFPHSDTLYDSQAAAQNAINSFLSWSKPKCCDNDDPKEGDMCKGSSVCTRPTCDIEPVTETEKQYDYSSWSCRCTVIDEETLEVTSPEGTCDDDHNCSCDEGVPKNTSCTESKHYKNVNITKYKVVNCTKPVLEVDSTYQCERNIYTYYYNMDVSGTRYDGDDIYCVQPGASGPGRSGQPYELNIDYDISQCKDQYTLKSGQKAVYCGLAHIMYQAYNVDATTLKFTNFKSDTYKHAAVTLALRLWMAAYGKNADGPGLGGGSEVAEGTDTDSAILGWIPKEDYYEITADLIRNGGSYSTANADIGKGDAGKISCAESKYHDSPHTCEEKNGVCTKLHQYHDTYPCVIDQAIELFHNTENVTAENYLGGINFKRSEPVVQIIDTSREIEITWDDPDSIQKIKTECTDFNNPNCIIEPHAYIYQNGRMIDVTDRLKLELDFCQKNTCRFIPKGIMEICIQGGSYVKVVLVFKNWSQYQGEMKFYTHSTQPNKYQVMMSMGVKMNECYQNGEGIKQGRIEREIDCGCPPESCTDLETKISYEGDEVCNPLKTISDASMDCITNACDSKAVADYDVTKEYSVDPLVCTLYEREENELYTPGAVSVYSGMQFSYDLGKDLEKRGINTQSNKKLTSVIIQKKQITAQIHYDYWYSEYLKKIDVWEDTYVHRSNYSNAYRTSAKNDVDNWINELKNCNMYANSDLAGEIQSRVNAIVNCTDPSCRIANVSIKYKGETGEKKYGDEQTLAVERHALSNSKYYCHGTSCYNYDRNAVFTEPNSANHTFSAKYLNCSGTSCSETTISIPDNTYATTINNIEHDYYNNKKYYVDAYTGNVTTENREDGNSTPLADYSYPISGNTKTNISGYPVQFKFTDLSNKKLQGYTTTSSCYIKVYNRTTAYDCKFTDSKGNMDLSNCEDTNYKIENGIPIIPETTTGEEQNQISWTSTNKKQYGYVVRFIDLDNPFPSGERTSVINWTTKDIEDIKKTANDIFTNPEYLEYSYVLTPTGIKNIKEYNSNQLSSGGYLNSTLEDCKIVTDETGLSTFTDCKSTFLHGELRKYDGVQISGNKAGAY